MHVKYDDETKLMFQIGDPIDHACAAALHNTMYEIANLNAVCTLVRVKKGDLPRFIEAAKAERMVFTLQCRTKVTSFHF